MHVECMVSTGGTSLKDDIMRLYSSVHILVGTPGRILDLSSKGVANLSQCKTVIMDEVIRNAARVYLLTRFLLLIVVHDIFC